MGAADLAAALMEGAIERVRPKLMAVAAIMAGLLLIIAHHMVDRRGLRDHATHRGVDDSGMVSSTVLTLIVILAVYSQVKAAAAVKPAPHGESSDQG